MISIIVPTIGRYHEVNLLFNSLTKSNFKFFEIILVDQNIEIDLSDIVSNYSKLLDIKHYKVNFKGVCRARNFGISHAKFPIVSTPDDDCEFLADTMDNAIYSLKEVDIVFGKCVDKLGVDSVTKFKKIESYVTINKIRGYAIEATMFAKLDTVVNIKYNENIGVGTFYGSDEIIDLVIRAIECGYIVKYNPNIVLIHPQVKETFLGDSFKRGFSYSCGTGRIARLHNSERLYFIKSLLKYCCAILFYLFRFKKNKAKYYFVRLLGLIVGNII